MEKECAFCQIVRGEKPADIVFQNESVVVFKDIRPHAPVHLLIVPKKHIRSLNDLAEQDQEVLSEMILIARKVAQEKEISNSGYRIVFNVERGGGQVIFHLHMHLLGGW
ncbi:MAG: histidine triad nucleotide-binding protein [Deltaproteobacteria bacterium RBG_16_49_23]|nr:MAG: histidine triad nucleotide-binding protein [Deltaproteobacteria bacterium RBG_16_49_23]